MKLPPFSFTKPTIPSKYTVYNLSFKTLNGLPILEGEMMEKINKKELRTLFNESYETFKKILLVENPRDLLDELRDIHFIISDKINRGKEWEFDEKFN